MATAAYSKKVQVSTTGTSGWQDVPCESPSLEHNGEILDDTDFSAAAPARGWRSKIIGLQGWMVNVGECNWAPNNQALTMIRTAFLNRTTLYVQYLPDGTTANGFKGEVKCESFNLGGDIAGKEMVTISLQGTGALGAA